MSDDADLKLGAIKAVSYSVDLVEHCNLRAAFYDALLASDSFADLEQYERMWNLAGRLSMLRNPLLEGIGLVPVGCFCVLNKNPAGVELAQWRLFCNFKRTHGGLVLPMENKGTPYVMSVFSSPMRVRAAT